MTAQIIATHYESAKRWIDYMLTFMKDGIIDRDQYGDWCVPPEDPKLIHSKDPEPCDEQRHCLPRRTFTTTSN